MARSCLILSWKNSITTGENMIQPSTLLLYIWTLECSHGINPQLQSKRFFILLLVKAIDCVDHNKLWKILKEMGIPDHLTCLLRNLDARQEATVRTGHGMTDCFQIGKGVHQGYILSPCLFNLYAEYIMRNAGLDEVLEPRLLGEISITSDMQMIPPLWQKVKRN